jgi:hypothetical protein
MRALRADIVERKRPTREGLVSTICEAFHCTPDAALRQDMVLVQRVIEYRSASLVNAAKDDVSGLTPEQIELFQEMEHSED